MKNGADCFSLFLMWKKVNVIFSTSYWFCQQSYCEGYYMK